MKWKALPLASAILLVVLLVACAPNPEPATQSTAPAPAAGPSPQVPVSGKPAVAAKAAWEDKWEKALAGARQEGRVSLANAGGSAVAVALMRGFKQAYGISLEVISGKGAELSTKIQAERRAGLYNFDLYMGGSSTPLTVLKPAGTFDPLEPALILPDLTDPAAIEKAWFGGKLYWIDRDHTMLAPLAYPNSPLAINTNLVKPEQIKSFNDLLDPVWKGKLLMNDPTVEGPGNVFFLFSYHVLGRDWLAALAKQEPQILRDQRLQMEWLVRGKVPILVAPQQATYYDFRAMGTPILGIMPKEGGWLTTTPASTSIMNKPPHPNAAKVFVNWMLSKEGLTILSQASGGQSARVDVPTDLLQPEAVREPGKNYWPKDTEEMLLKGPEMIKMAKELFGPLMK